MRRVEIRVEIPEWEIDTLVSLDPAAVDVLEALEVDDEEWRQRPDVQLFGSLSVRLLEGFSAANPTEKK